MSEVWIITYDKFEPEDWSYDTTIVSVHKTEAGARKFMKVLPTERKDSDGCEYDVEYAVTSYPLHS